MYLAEGHEENIPPEGVAAVCTTTILPMRYPIGCPEFDQELMARAEPTGDEWLVSGRAAALKAIREGTMPRNPCEKAFLSGMLGLQYSSDVWMHDQDKPEFLVVQESPTALGRGDQQRQ